MGESPRGFESLRLRHRKKGPFLEPLFPMAEAEGVHPRDIVPQCHGLHAIGRTAFTFIFHTPLATNRCKANPSLSPGKYIYPKGYLFCWRRRRGSNPRALFHNATGCTRLGELLLLLYSIPLSPPIAVRRIPPFHPANIFIRKGTCFAGGGKGNEHGGCKLHLQEGINAQRRRTVSINTIPLLLHMIIR